MVQTGSNTGNPAGTPVVRKSSALAAPATQGSAGEPKKGNEADKPATR